MRLLMVIASVVALAVPAAAFAGDGSGGKGFEQHLARATAAVEKLTTKCDVAKPPARCADAKARLTAKLQQWEALLQARVDKVSAKPAGTKQAARLDELKSRLAQVQALEAKLA